MRVDLPPRLKARLDPAERYGLRVTLVGLAIVLVAVPFSILTFLVVTKGPIDHFDGRVANALNHWVNDHHWLVPTLDAVSWLGRPPLLAAWVLVAVVVLWRAGRHRVSIFLVVTSLGGGIVDTLVKAAVNRPRPTVDHPVASAFGKSFPSGHAMSSTVTYGALVVALLPLVPRRWRRPAIGAATVLVAAVGCSRLLLGVHFVTDVVGGYVLGLAWLAGATAAFDAWQVEEHRERRRRSFRASLRSARPSRPDPVRAVGRLPEPPAGLGPHPTAEARPPTR